MDISVYAKGRDKRTANLPEAEEVADFLLAGLGADALDVDGVGHVVWCCSWIWFVLDCVVW